jgi:hypothetical protein
VPSKHDSRRNALQQEKSAQNLLLSGFSPAAVLGPAGGETVPTGEIRRILYGPPLDAFLEIWRVRVRLEGTSPTDIRTRER